MKHKEIVLLLLMLLISSCAWFGTEPEKTADELMTEGTSYYEDGRYKKAIESFETLRDWYPFSKYAITAELKIADAYFEIEEYEDAAFAYENFENLHPRNEKTPYAVYRIARCYYLRVDTVDRDQTPAAKALATYDRLIKMYPDSPYAEPAREERFECFKSLAGNDLYVGLFYYKSEKYKAALGRFKDVVSQYPDVGTHLTALEHIPLCEAAIRQEEIEKQMETADDDTDADDTSGEPE